MPKITDYYNLPSQVPFADVDVFSDNRLFVDPHAVRLSKMPSPFAAEAVLCADTFCHEVTQAVITGTPASRQRGEKLLQQFGEPSETRLGMSARGFKGHGGSEGVGSLIWETFNSDVEFLVRMGVLRQIEDLPVFVEGVDRDITSDVTTRIIFGPLARFTEAMIATYPQFTAGTHVCQTFTRQVWDPTSLQWATEEMLLPVVDGSPLLLVPQEWVRRNLLMSARRYYDTSVLSYAQFEQAAISADGKILTTPKRVLKQQADLRRGRSTSIQVTRRALENEQDLLELFKAFVASKHQTTTGSDEAAA